MKLKRLYFTGVALLILAIQSTEGQEKKITLFKEVHTNRCTEIFIQKINDCNDKMKSNPEYACYWLLEGLSDDNLTIDNTKDLRSLEEQESYNLGSMADFFYKEQWSVKIIYLTILMHAYKIRSEGRDEGFDVEKYSDTILNFLKNLDELKKIFSKFNLNTSPIENVSLLTRDLHSTFLELEANLGKPESIKLAEILSERNQAFYVAIETLKKSIHAKNGILEKTHENVIKQKPYYAIAKKDYDGNPIIETDDSSDIKQIIDRDYLKYEIVLRDKIMALKIRTLLDLALNKPSTSFEILVEVGMSHLRAFEKNWKELTSEPKYKNQELSLEIEICEDR